MLYYLWMSLVFREIFVLSMIVFGESYYDNIDLEFILYVVYVSANSQDILISFFNMSNSEKYINIIRTLHFV